MPIDNARWQNCKKCGHRYDEKISRCPRCGAASNVKTKSVAIKVGAAAGIAVAAVAALLLFGSQITAGLASAMNATGTGVTGIKEIITETSSEPLIKDSISLDEGATKVITYSAKSTEQAHIVGTIAVRGSGVVQVDEGGEWTAKIRGPNADMPFTQSSPYSPKYWSVPDDPAKQTISLKNIGRGTAIVDLDLAIAYSSAKSVDAS